MNRATGFDWDSANEGHISRHGITRREAEEVLRGASFPLARAHRSGEERHTELGETGEGRLIIVVWAWRDARVRVVNRVSG